MTGREQPIRIVFMGTGDIGLPSLQLLLQWNVGKVVAVVTQPDKPVGRKQVLTPSAIKTLALEKQLPVLQPLKLRHAEAVAELAQFQPDLVVVMAYGQILPRVVLDLPKLACINLHASLLPRHRGAAPIQAAILAGDPATGITVMHMAEGLDTGDMILKRELPIFRRETGGSLHDKLATLAAEALADALPRLVDGSANRFTQKEELATYAPKLSREDGAIDWNAGCFPVYRKIQAMNPWPGAYANLLLPGEGPKKLKLFSSIIFRKTFGAPGEILRSDHRGILVGTGDGSILLTEVQLEGKRKMRAGDFLLGAPQLLGFESVKHSNREQTE